ncbi:MAG: DNA repair protein RecN [Bacilli bacterium]|nr:DNA repair protein RecN [Bacilli bacterium]
MLKQLLVNNFAIIENIDIKFDDGFTVLTGETGAGKSLIIDSLSLLLGERASLELIRNGENKATIKGIFSLNNIHLTSLLNELGVPTIEEDIIIERIITISKSIVKINGVTISLNDLKRVSKYIADIHMQFDNEKILNPDNYLEIIDGFKYETIKEYLDKYLANREDFKNKKKEYLALVDKKKKIEERREFYQFELKELEELALKVDEDKDIEEEISLLKNYDKIYTLFEEASSIIDSGALDKIYELKGIIKNLSNLQNGYVDTYESINDHYYELEDKLEGIKKDFKHLDYNPHRLEELENRKHDIEQIKKKYHKSIEELIAYKDELSSLLKNEEDLDLDIIKLHQSMVEAYNHTYDSANELSLVRQQIAKSIKNELEKNMLDLSLKAKFSFAFAKIEKEPDFAGNIFLDNGIDTVNFYIETNIGEGMKPLNKIISGGEASRIMLAIKALFIKSQKISTVIFDEIDTGISGEIARKVAEKIYEISLNTQVIAITHMPQVAAMSKNHIKIYKEEKNGRTFTYIKPLSLNEKIEEIALMISGGKITQSQLEYAKEMVLNKN